MNRMVREEAETVVGDGSDNSVGSLQLFEQLENKMYEQPEYSKMMLLRQMKDQLKTLAKSQDSVTTDEYEKMVDELYREAEGKVVDPFIPIKDAISAQDDWYGEQVADSGNLG